MLAQLSFDPHLRPIKRGGIRLPAHRTDTTPPDCTQKFLAGFLRPLEGPNSGRDPKEVKQALERKDHGLGFFLRFFFFLLSGMVPMNSFRCGVRLPMYTMRLNLANAAAWASRNPFISRFSSGALLRSAVQ